ncbi:MAG: hypothetical protein H0T55_09805 [Rubrobacteraceae bacterium]|nr:hypothetical protein [Rubrobacteraceae bacterium]MDQ3184482.1 hypothetical protein [Actinomycetota bacterium]
MQDARVSAGLPREVRKFLEAVLESYPDLDIRLLATARRREPSEEGCEPLIKAMRDLLQIAQKRDETPANAGESANGACANSLCDLPAAHRRPG